MLCAVTITSSADLRSRCGTKHGIWPPKDGRIKRTETCRGLFVFTNMFFFFNILVFLNVKVSVF